MRVLLIRRREGDPAADAVRRAILVDTAAREMAIRIGRGPGRARLDAVADVDVPSFGAPMTDPIFLVCTNGKRDACCALRGRALMTALAPTTRNGSGSARISEATDSPATSCACRTASSTAGSSRGWPAPGRCLPGRPARPRAAPRSIRLARTRPGRRAGAAPAPRAGRASTTSGWWTPRSTATVPASSSPPRGAEHRFELRRRARHPPRPTSCRADELEEPIHWRVVEARADPPRESTAAG